MGGALDTVAALPERDRSRHPSLAVCGIDRLFPDAISVLSDPSRCTMLLGWPTRPGDVAATVGVSPGVTPAALARAVLDRFGDATPRVMAGEWALVDWTPAATLLMIGSACRDPLLYARVGRRLAIGPDLDWLVALPWVGRDIDPLGGMLSLGTAPTRQRLADRTFAVHVRRVRAGHSVRISADGERTAACDLSGPATPFHGSFEDAIGETEALLRRIAAEHADRGSGAACLLSGGLDSSVTTLMMSDAFGPARPVACLSSAAPPGSMLPDEVPIARQVAEALALPLHPVFASDAASAFRPSEAHMLGTNAPPLAMQPYLYDALSSAAEDRGRPLLVDGLFGELTISAYGTERSGTWHRLRNVLRRGSPLPFAQPRQTHARLARHRVTSLRQALLALPSIAAPRVPARGELWGHLAGTDNARNMPTDMRQGRSRRLLPLRDHRLLDLFAGFPIAFAEQDGQSRAFARRILAGRVPDAIRLRPAGMPFAPDYRLRIQRQAPEALARMAVFRRAELDDWLDLDWLERGLRHLASGRPVPAHMGTEVQLTAGAAEYFLWWQTR